MELSNIFIVILSIFMICKQHFSYGNIMSLADDVIQRRINDFREYCPVTRLCNTSARERPPNNSWQSPCCTFCDCGNDCGLDCCPDKSAHFESEEEMYYLKNVIQCVDTRYGFDENDFGMSYLMVSRCPYGYTDFEIAEQCAREYSSEIALDVPLRYILPGYDNYTRLIYKNIFCARCHNVHEDTLYLFDINLRCSQRKKSVNENAHCEIWFLPDMQFPSYNLICDHSIIRRCNVTGQWEMYDKYLEESCLSYTSVFKNFRNVHCFLCNGFNASTIKTLCGHIYTEISEQTTQPKLPEELLEFLDWTPDIGPSQVEEKTQKEVLPIVDCLQSIIFNVSETDDWFTFCPDGMVVQNNTCIFPQSALPLYIVMEINLMLEPKFVSEQKSKYTMNQLLSDVLKEIQNMMSLLRSTDLQLYKVTGFVGFNEFIRGLHGEVIEVHMESVDAIALKIQTLKYTSKMDNVETPVKDFDRILTNISDFGNFNARFHHFHSDLVLDGFDGLPSLSCTPDLDQQEYTLFCRTSLPIRNDELFFEIETNLNRSVNMPYHIIAAEPEPFCPRVALPKLFLCNESSVKNIYSNIFLNKKLSENKTHMFFCYQDHIQHLNSLDKEPNERESTRDTSTSAHFYLTLACLIPSIICLVLTLIVYSFYPILRTLPGLNNMALVTSLILFQSTALVNTVSRIDLPWLCAFVGVFTHFSLILSFAWMFVCTFHMLNVFVKIRNQNVARNVYKIFFSYTAFTIGVALTAVILVVIVELVQSGGTDIGYGGKACYIKKSIMIIAVVAVPVAMVTLIDIVMFGAVIYKIKKLPVLASSNSQERNNIKIVVKLSTLTGMTWVFGFLYIFTRLDTFAHIFIVLNAGQSVFIMLSFICNWRVLNLVLKTNIKPSARQDK